MTQLELVLAILPALLGAGVSQEFLFTSGDGFVSHISGEYASPDVHCQPSL